MVLFALRIIAYLLKMERLVDVASHCIPADLIINSDQTGIDLVPARDCTMEQRGAHWEEIWCVGDKRLITATFVD